MDIRTERIVVGYDGSASAAVALDWAAAEAEHRRLPLTVLHVVDNAYVVEGMAVVTARADESAAAFREVAAEGAQRARKIAGSVEVSADTLIEGIAHALIEGSRGAALLVVGTRGHGELPSVLLGSVAFAVSSHAHCPVTVVRGDAQHPGIGRPVVVGVDGSECSDVALRYAAAAAARAGAALVVVSSYPVLRTPGWGPAAVFNLEQAGGPKFGTVAQLGAGTLVREAAALARDAHPELEVREVVVEGRSGTVLAQAAAGCGLLVVGSRGRGGFAGLLLGSVGHEVIQSAPCPVAVVRR